MDIKQVKKDFDDGVLLGKETLRQLIAHALLIETCASKQVDEWNAVHNGHKALVRELDVLLNGNAGAAKQASLCDIVAQVRGMVNPVGWAPTYTGQVRESPCGCQYAQYELQLTDCGVEYEGEPPTLYAIKTPL